MLEPALITLRDVGDNREVFRRVREADPTNLIHGASEHGEQLTDVQLVGVHAAIIPHLYPPAIPNAARAATYFWGRRTGQVAADRNAGMTARTLVPA